VQGEEGMVRVEGNTCKLADGGRMLPEVADPPSVEGLAGHQDDDGGGEDEIAVAVERAQPWQSFVFGRTWLRGEVRRLPSRAEGISITVQLDVHPQPAHNPHEAAGLDDFTA
jgi:hypothetical protein